MVEKIICLTIETKFLNLKEIIFLITHKMIKDIRLKIFQNVNKILN